MNQTLQEYYALHARIYDATRWSFLFGRSTVLKRVAKFSSPGRILEVGCGTGHNLRRMRQLFPQAEITGVDLSADMLRIAKRRAPDAKLIQQAYDRPIGGSFDLVVFSYALSMFNPGWEQAIRAAKEDLAPGGVLAVVDFSHTRLAAFRGWMKVNHVRMDGHLWDETRRGLEPLVDDFRRAYSGLWHYGTFIGRVGCGSSPTSHGVPG